MNEQPTPRSLIVDLGVLLVSEVLGYIAFLVNVPFALSLVATIFVIVIVLQDVYGLEPLRLLAWTGIPAKGHFQRRPEGFPALLRHRGVRIVSGKGNRPGCLPAQTADLSATSPDPIIVSTLGWAWGWAASLWDPSSPMHRTPSSIAS